MKEQTLKITITGTQYSEWQGFVCSPPSENPRPFSSLMELLEIMKDSVDTPCNLWKEKKK